MCYSIMNENLLFIAWSDTISRGFLGNEFSLFGRFGIIKLFELVSIRKSRSPAIFYYQWFCHRTISSRQNSERVCNQSFYQTFSSFLDTLLPDVINGFFGHGGLIDASYWTLTIEFLFYAGIGIFCSLFSYKNIRYFLTAWLVFSIAAFLYHIDQNFYVKLFLVRHASYFIFGSALALIATKQARNIYEKYFDWLLLFVSSVYSVYIHQEAIPPYPNPNPFDTNIVTILLIVFFVSIPILVYLSRYVKNPKIIRGLAIVGGLTYPLYLLHQRIGNVAINYFTNIYNIPWNNFAIGFEVFIILIAYILYLQDKKIRAWLRKKLIVRE